MASAIIRGLIGSGVRGNTIWAYDTDERKLLALETECGITVCPSPDSVVAGVDTLVLAVKPQVFPVLLPPLSASLHAHRPLIISIAAGRSLASVEALVGAGLPLVRVMPNINAKVGEAVSAFCGNAQVTDEMRATVRHIFESVGTVMELEERFFSAFSVLASCSPAYTLMYADALAEAGVVFGLPKDKALDIVTQSILGTVRLLQESEEHPRVLMDQICSPAGTTVEGVRALEERAFAAAVMAAASASYERDQAL